MDLLKTMTPDNLRSLLDQALTAGQTELAAMVRDELDWRDHSAHEETDPWHPMPGAIAALHPHEPRLWPPRQVKAQPVAPHNTDTLIEALERWRPVVPSSADDLLGKAIQQLRWYQATRAADEVGY